MDHLVVVEYWRDVHRSSEVFDRLSAMEDGWVVDMRDAVAVRRDSRGKLRVDQSYERTAGEGATLGGLLGALIGLMLGAVAATSMGGPWAAAAGALMAGVLAGGSFGAAGGAIAATRWKGQFGIPNGFVKAVGAMLQPGDSAIVALLSTSEPDILAERFRGYGGTALQATLAKVQSDKLQAVLEGWK